MAIDSDDSEFKEGDVVVQIGCEETSVIQGRNGDDYIAYSENEYGRHTYGMKVSYMDKHYVKVGRVNKRLRKEIAEENRRHMPHG